MLQNTFGHTAALVKVIPRCRQQAITWANIDPNLCRLMVPTILNCACLIWGKKSIVLTRQRAQYTNKSKKFGQI